MSEPATQNYQNANLTAASVADKAARDAAIKEADNFFKADIKDAPQGNPSDLFKKFATKLNQDSAEQRDQIDAAKEARSVEENTNDDEPKIKASLVDDEKKPGFIKSLKQTNEQLSKEAVELKKKIDEYEKAKLPEYEKQIEELRSKIDDGGTKKQMEQLQKDLELTVKEKQEREEKLNAELDDLRKANAYLNLPADPIFQETFDQPIAVGYNQVKMLLSEDPTSIMEFEKAVAAYQASLQTPDQNERIRQREISKQTLNAIYENLSPMEQAKFNSTAYDVLGKVESRIQALQEWEVTRSRTEEEKSRRTQMNKSQVSKRWNDAFAEAKKQLDDSIKYPEEVAKLIASNKIDDDTSEDELIAESALRENSNFAPEQITRVLQQGAKFKKARAYTFALEKQVSELNETIKKMRGSSTSEGGVSSSSSGKANQEEELTPAGLFAKFRNR